MTECKLLCQKINITKPTLWNLPCSQWRGWLITVYLAHRNIITALQPYTNTYLTQHAFSIVRPKKPDYEHWKSHRIFENRLKQDFTAAKINKKWYTDFTYLFLANHEVKYNYMIIDLHDRSVLFAMLPTVIWQVTLRFAHFKKNWIHSHGAKGNRFSIVTRTPQYTSKTFVEFYESIHVAKAWAK